MPTRYSIFFEESGHFQNIGEQTIERLRFRVRGVFHYLYIEQILKPKLAAAPWEEIENLPGSFLWDNCEYYKEIADLVKSYTFNKEG